MGFDFWICLVVFSLALGLHDGNILTVRHFLNLLFGFSYILKWRIVIVKIYDESSWTFEPKKGFDLITFVSFAFMYVVIALLRQAQSNLATFLSNFLKSGT